VSAQPQRVSPASGSLLATVLFTLLLLSGAALRLADLEHRPLHGDEAVGASLSSTVSRTGSFLYESSNRHGPFQYVLSGLVMRWKGESTFWIRFPYALAGSLLILACFGFRRPLGDFGWLLSCALLTFSPIFIYYSRYAVQEIHFVVATALLLSCGLAFAWDGRGIWLFGFLLSAAWMMTIKETFVIVWGCLAAALAISLVVGGREFRRSVSEAISHLKARPLAGILGLLAGFLLVVMAYSDFFRDFSGLGHLAVNLARMLRHGASTADAVELHRHPASLYLSLLLRFEWLTSALAAVGVWVGLRWRRPRTLLMSTYVLLSLAAYCALSYKTPWLILSPLLAMALVAGDGIGQLLCRRPWRISPRVRLVGASALPLILLPQVFESSFTRPADPALGLAYHHAGEANLELVQEIRDTLARVPSYSYPRAIIALPYYWPLAWYLRDEPDVVFDSSPAPSLNFQELSMVPVVVTLESADPKFLKAFVHTDSLPAFALPSHTPHRVILVPPDYMVGRVWIRNDLARPSSSR
jgi:uncharacterized protein (TIGR03663 family)